MRSCQCYVPLKVLTARALASSFTIKGLLLHSLNSIISTSEITTKFALCFQIIYGTLIGIMAINGTLIGEHPDAYYAIQTLTSAACV